MKKIAILLTALFPSLALAHAGHGELSFAAGALHLFSGLDHLLALMAAGLCLGAIGRRQQTVHIAAIGLTLLAAIIIAPHLPAFNTEPAITATLVVLGSFVALAVSISATARLALLGGVAAIHGLTHGQEMAAQSLAYAAGLTGVSVMVMGASAWLASALNKGRVQWLLRSLGAAVAAGGLALFAS